jgi:hypothetical protein
MGLILLLVVLVLLFSDELRLPSNSGPPPLFCSGSFSRGDDGFAAANIHLETFIGRSIASRARCSGPYRPCGCSFWAASDCAWAMQSGRSLRLVRLVCTMSSRVSMSRGGWGVGPEISVSSYLRALRLVRELGKSPAL